VIQVSDELLIGNSDDESNPHLALLGIRGILNTATDLYSRHRWDRTRIEYAHVGLIDGPGNEIADYCAALLCLKMLVRHRIVEKDGKKQGIVLVCDHEGSRALVVALMYLNFTGGQWRPDTNSWSHWPTWEERLAEVRKFTDTDLPEPHEAHVKAFNKIPWGVLEVL